MVALRFQKESEMALIIKRKRKTKTTYFVFVRRKGVKTISKSFINKTDAKKWARVVERKLDTGSTRIIQRRPSFFLAICSGDRLARRNIKKRKVGRCMNFGASSFLRMLLLILTCCIFPLNILQNLEIGKQRK